MNQGVLHNIMLTWLLGNLKLHETAWKYPSGHTSHLPSRLHHSKEAVNEEEENRTHGFAYVIPVDMEHVECEEDEIQMMHGEEGVEVSRTNVRNRRKPHDDCCHQCNEAGEIVASAVRPFDQLHPASILAWRK